MLSPVIRVGLTRRDAATPKRACGMAALGASLHALATANAAPPTLRRHGTGPACGTHSHHPARREMGRVAQRESTTLTS